MTTTDITSSKRDLEPLAVSPRQACLLLGIGITRLYQLIGNGELRTYREGRARRITTDSIKARFARLAGTSDAPPLPRRRGRPRKHPGTRAADMTAVIAVDDTARFRGQ